ncbi:MAG: PAS domain S-box protein [gamma proteobacterium symbiont of Taylorina sp.]|nr:PAS domain S-box protein [gamma proteobacterium symbiont of Taylorina sp.]
MGYFKKLFFLMILLIPAFSFAQNVNFIVVAIHGIEVAKREWQPTIDYLQQTLPHHTFNLIPVEPINLPEIRQQINLNKIDFVITQPAIYVDLEINYGISRILTMVKKNGVAEFGSTIIVRADSKIRLVDDLKGKKIAGVAKIGFGGWLIGYKELLDNGFDPFIDAREVVFLGNQTKEIDAVLNGDVDVAVIRTGVLEKFSAEGKIDISDFQIILPKTYSGFPYKISSPLYPEWALAKTKKVSNKLSRSVALALLSLKQNSSVAKKARFQEWTFPYDYQPVHELLKTLKVEPYKNYGKVSIIGFMEQHIIGVIIILAGMTVFLLMSIIIYRSNIKLSGERLEKEKLINYQDAVLGAIPDLMYKLDEEGKYLDVWAQNLEKLTSSKESLIGNSVSEMLPADAAEQIMIALKEAAVNGQSCGQQIKLVTPGGERWFELSTCMEKGYSVPRHFIMLSQDITERQKKEFQKKKIENQLKQSEEKFRTIAENSQMGIFIYTDRYIYVNRAFSDMTHYTFEELYQKRPWEILEPSHQKEIKDIVQRRLSGEHFPKKYKDLIMIDKYGNAMTVRLITETIKYGEGFAGLGTVIDITDIKRTKKQLQLLSQAIEQSDDLIRITDKDGIITYVNDAFVAHTGYKHSELIGQKSGIIKSGKHDQNFYKNLWQTIQSGKTFHKTILNRKKEGQIYHEELMISPMLNEHKEIQYYIATGKDITSRINMEHELLLRATTDYLTGLYNRQKGSELLDSEIDRVKRYGSSLAIIMFDIDKFKSINDTFGHDIGDKVLTQLSQMISFQIRKSDSLIRWGGEEFIIISPQNSADEIKLFAEKIRNEIDFHSFEIIDHVSISIGVTLFKQNEGKEALLKRVDNALFKAKSAGRNCVEFM